MHLRLTVLGSGTSTGVPVIGCDCPVCTSTDAHDKRMRASLLITVPSGEHIVIDTGPDFRMQMLQAGVRRLEQEIYTHTHADHCHGFDDLRAFYFMHRKPVQCHVAARHEQDFRARFSYVFEDTGYIGTKPQVALTTFDTASFTVLGVTFEPVFLPHGAFQTAAFRFGSVVYATDFKSIPAEVRDRWRGKVRTMIASGIHFSPHPSHSSIPETIALFADLQVERGYITHLAHQVGHAAVTAALPEGVHLAYDGLVINAGL